MTCIVAIETTHGVIFASDSAGVAGTHADNRVESKVFQNGQFVIGFSGSFRVGQILRYVWKPPEQHPDVDDMAFLVRDVVGGFRKLFLENGVRYFNSTNDSFEGPFLLGYKGKVYKVDVDFQVARSRDGYNACGSGSRVALGALHAISRTHYDTDVLPFSQTKGLHFSNIALEAAEYFDSAVRRPFSFVVGEYSQTPKTTLEGTVSI